MDKNTLQAIQNMSAQEAQRYLANQEEKSQSRAEALEGASLDELVRRRDKINPRDQASRNPLDDEIKRRLLSQSQGIAASRMREVIKAKLKSNIPLNFQELKARASTLNFSGDLRVLSNEASDEVLFESKTPRSSEERELAEWRRLDAEKAEDEDNQSSPRDQFKKFARAEVLSDRQFNWETFEKEASRMGLDEDFHNVVREVLNETDDDSG